MAHFGDGDCFGWPPHWLHGAWLPASSRTAGGNLQAALMGRKSGLHAKIAQWYEPKHSGKFISKMHLWSQLKHLYTCSSVLIWRAAQCHYTRYNSLLAQN